LTNVALEIICEQYNCRKEAKPDFSKAVISRDLLKTMCNVLYHAHEHLKSAATIAAEATAAKEAAAELALAAAPAAAAANTDTMDVTVLQTLQQIQHSINRLEQKYGEIEAIVAPAKPMPMTYADIARSNAQTTSTSLPKLHQAGPTMRLKTLRKEQAANNAKASITLSTKNTSTTIKEEIMNAPNKVIAERLQKAINAGTTQGTNPKILGISKLTNAIRVHLEKEEEARAIRIVQDDIDWSTAFGAKSGIKLHTPKYAIVAHGVPISHLSEEANQDTIRQVEEGNSMPAGCITKVTNLRRRQTQNQTQNHAVVLYLNDRQQANKCITKGIYINYTHYTIEMFTPQSQITQCYKCHVYGHQAASCKHHVRCGKCSNNHSTKECKTKELHCIHCAGNHEAWHFQCPVRIAERTRLNELKKHSPELFK